MQIQLVDVLNQYKKIKDEIRTAIDEVLESGQYILGKNVFEFENNCSKYLNIKHAIGVSSGTDALLVSLMAIGIEEDDEVITTAFTFAATVETILLLKAKPIYVDIENDSFNIDFTKIENVITRKTKAIIPVHLYGQSCEMDEILSIAKKYNLYVIEDAAQSFGAEFKNKKTGTFGNIGTTSFFPSKNLGAFGDAGMVFTNDDKLAEKIRAIIVHGSKERYYHEILGVNARLDTIQSAILNVKLKYLDMWNSQRQKFAKIYDELFQNSNIIIPITKLYRNHIFHQYTIKVERRDELTEFLKSKNVPFGIYYPLPLHKQKAYFCKNNFLPNTEMIANQVISLPMHTELTFEMQKYIVETILSFYK